MSYIEGLDDKSRTVAPRPHNISYVISIKFYPGCYCHLQISSTATLEDLALEIQSIFGMNDGHMSSFYMNNSVYTSSDEYGVPNMFGDMSDAKYNADDYTLASFNFKKGDKFKYLYNFMADYIFQCQILRVISEKTIVPIVLRAKGC